MDIQKNTKFLSKYWFIFLFTLKSLGQTKNHPIFIENIKVNEKYITYTITNKSNKKINYFTGIDFWKNNEWGVYRYDLTINSLKRKAKVLILQPKSTISNSHSIDSLFGSDFEYYKDNVYKLCIYYRIQNKKFNKNYSTEFKFK